MAGCVQYPAAGCVVEFFDASSAQLGLVLEEAGGRLRLLLPSRREAKIPSSRVLPWCAAPLPSFASMGREDMIRHLEECRRRREAKAAEIPVEELWEMAQGEVERAPAQWFAELVENDPDADAVAAYGRALLAARTRFRFAPPNFEVYDAEKVARREEEARRQRERDRLLAEGTPFVRILWNAAQGRGVLPPEGSPQWPSPDVAERLEAEMRRRMADPEGDAGGVWPSLAKGLPDEGVLAAQLLLAWGKIEKHHNVWFDRAGYARGDAWWRRHAADAEALAAAAAAEPLPDCPIPFVSIDGESTRDIDDAFHLERREGGGMTLTLALACPALNWPFGSGFDQQILRRGTSVYLPEGDCHMLPEFLGTGAFSLLEGEPRPALVVAQDLAADGSLEGECRVGVARAALAANLRYRDCQEVLDGAPREGSAAARFEPMLRLAAEFGDLRLARRVEQGAVSLEKDEPDIVLSGDPGDPEVDLVPGGPPSAAQNMVAEMMILASAAVAGWAFSRGIPMIYRTQNVSLPRDYAGVWRDPVRIAEIMRDMIPSSLETQPRQHAALGLSAYAPVTSPLRRYADLVNEAQIVAAAAGKAPVFTAEALDQLLLSLRMALDDAGRIQRFRPRYWKQLFFRQRGDEVWWPGVVTDETEMSATVCLPQFDVFLRGRRRLFDERTCPGSRVRVRIGKVNPLNNEMHLLECAREETFPDGDLSAAARSCEEE